MPTSSEAPTLWCKDCRQQLPLCKFSSLRWPVCNPCKVLRGRARRATTLEMLDAALWLYWRRRAGEQLRPRSIPSAIERRQRALWLASARGALVHVDWLQQALPQQGHSLEWPARAS